MSNNAVTDYQQHPEQLLARYGKSFHWAGLFLTKTQRKAAEKVYAFCRYVDDIVDENPNKQQAKLQIQHIKTAIDAQKSEDIIVEQMLDLMQQYPIHPQVVHDLIDGVAWDLSHSLIDSEADLFRYSYGVASTVGLLMCGIFKVTDPQALAFAVDLGLAMQFTNIARDVQEDAEKGRIYLPQQWFQSPISAQDILDSQQHSQVYAQIKKLLQLADQYYASADHGLAYLPWRARLSILIASQVYQAIGLKALNMGEQAYWQCPRVFTTKWEKIKLSSQAFTQLCSTRKYYQPHQHNSELHHHLSGLVGHLRV